MAVLELTEASKAMREAARSWSAGAIGIDDYRMIRRATLASMLGLDPDDEETVAGMFEALPSDDTETVEHVAPAPPAKGGDRTLLIVAGVVVLLGGLAAMLLIG